MIFAAAALVAAVCTSPTIGADVTNISRAYRAEHHVPDYIGGALIRAVRPKSPATAAGLQAGDVVQGVDGDLIQNACGFTSRIEKHACGETKLSVYRAGATQPMQVRVISRVYPKDENNQRACLDGNGAACTSLAVANGDDIVLLRQACDLGDAEGCYVLGLKLKDPKEQARAYEQGCDGGYSQSCNNLAWMYENGSAVNMDLAAAVRLYKQACDGSPCSIPNNLGCVNLGRAFHAGRGTERNFAVSTRLFRDVCSRSPVPGSDEDAATIMRACSLAGTALVLGEGTTTDAKHGLSLLERGCAANDTFGCYNLGAFYETGTGVTANKNRARTYYQRACDHGDTEACDRLALLNK